MTTSGSSDPAALPGGLPANPPEVPLFERFFAGLVLYLATGAGIPLLEYILHIVPPQDVQSGDPFAQRIWSAVYLLSAVLIFVRLPRVVRALPSLGALWVLLGLAMGSVAWSLDPGVTLRRSVALAGTTVVAIYLGTRYARRELFVILFWVFTAVCIISLVAALVSIGTSAGPVGSWRGAFGSKNDFGHTMAMAGAVTALYTVSPTPHRRLGLGVFCLSLALLVLSGSKGALVVLLAGLLVLPVSKVWRLRPGLVGPAALATVAACGALGTWIAGNSDAVLNLLGRDATLTGRTPLWALVWGKVTEQPWFGYGYGGFWLQWNPPSGEIWRSSMWTGGWLPPNAHNGFLDLLADLGFVGLSAFLISFGSNVVRSLRLMQQDASSLDLFPLLFLYLYTLSNVTETALVVHNSLPWMLYVTLTIQLGLVPKSGQPRAYAPARAASLGGA
jgi:exopolysaccharide production protein ExoQ